jgi:hypothetical protein
MAALPQNTGMKAQKQVGIRRLPRFFPGGGSDGMTLKTGPRRIQNEEDHLVQEK